MKKIWLIIQGILFAMSIFSYWAHAENVFGIVVTVFIIESFPLNMLAGWLFFAYGDLAQYPSVLFLMISVFSGLGYIQWFHLVPGVASFFGRKFAKHDRQVELLIKPVRSKQIGESVADPAINSFANEKYSPVERVFLQDANRDSGL